MADSNEATVIAGGTQIKGELVFEGSARVIGQVEGKVIAKGDLHVAEQGMCRAQIEAENVQIDGTVEGDLTAAQRVQLNEHGKIQGDLVAEKLVTAEGASIIGHVQVGRGVSASGGVSAKPEVTIKAQAAGKKPEPAPA